MLTEAGKNATFTMSELLAAASSLEPEGSSEYGRGICELLGRALLDQKGIGEGTGENAIMVAAELSISPRW